MKDDDRRKQNDVTINSNTNVTNKNDCDDDDDENWYDINVHNNSSNEQDKFHVIDEMKQLLHIAMPAVVLQFNMMIIFLKGATVVGQTIGEVPLAGFSLGTLVANMTYLSIVVGTLSAADTLMPRSYGSRHYPEIGLLAVRSTIVCGLLLLPVIFIFAQPRLIQYILIQLLKQDSIASTAASYWIQYYLIGTPANIMFRVMTSFLVSQEAPWPPVYATFIPTYVFNPILQPLLVKWYGLSGSALAISITQWCCLLFLLLYVRLRPYVYESTSWPGLSIQLIIDAVKIQPLIKFVSLSAGGVLSLSEWWFWEVMCFVAGSFGVVSLCAHTIAYNLVPLSFMLPLGISIGLVVRMGSIISTNPKKAKTLALCTMIFAILVGTMLVSCLWFFQVPIIKLFTNEDEVIIQSQVIWPMVCYHIWLLNIFGINGGICKALGMQWTVATYVFICLWCLTLPTTLYLAGYHHGGLVMEWYIMPTSYTIMQFGIMYSYLSMDWDQRSKDIRNSLTATKFEPHPDDNDVTIAANFASEKTSLI